MKLKHIDTAPVEKDILLYWKNLKHFENGSIYVDDVGGGVRYHTLFDGECFVEQPSHWCELPEE